MKCYAIFLLVICVVATANGVIDISALDEIVGKYQSECIKETGTSASDVEYARRDRRFCDDGHLDRYAFCLLKKYNIITSDGTVNQDSSTYAANLVTDNPESLGMVQKCTQLKGDHPLTTARQIINCVIKSDVSVFDFRTLTRNSSNKK